MSENVKVAPNSISIGPDVKFVGSIYTSGSADIQGEVVGKIEAQSLLVGKTGHVSGDVTVNEINVYGELHKEVTCASRMVIHATAICCTAT